MDDRDFRTRYGKGDFYIFSPPLTPTNRQPASTTTFTGATTTTYKLRLLKVIKH